jgi:hypothetical protein
MGIAAGAVARRDQSHTLGFFVGAHTSTRPKAVRPDPRASLCDSPPRGRPNEGPMDSPFRIEYLDAERMPPVLVRKAA